MDSTTLSCKSFIMRILNFVAAPVTIQPMFFLLLYVLLHLLDLFFYGGFPLLSPLLKIVFGIFVCYVLIFPTIFFSSIIRKAYKFVILLLAIVQFVVDLYLVIVYNETFSTLHVDVLAAIVATNPVEAKEYINSYLTIDKFLLIAFTLLILLLGWYYLNKLRFKMTQLTSIIISVVILFTTAVSAFHYKKLVLGNIYFLFRTEAPNLTDYLHNPLIKGDESAPEYVVLVVGESFAKSHSSMYGYLQETNPLLSTVSQDSLLIVYKNVTSAATKTIPAFKSLMTSYTDEMSDSIKWYECLTLIEIMKNRQYNTIWLSNQDRKGYFDNEVSCFAALCDEQKFAKEMYGKVDYDECLLPLLREIVSHSGTRNFIIVNLMGSHIYYSARYPHSYAKFSAGDYSESHSHLSAAGRNTLAEYDNSILYNDYVVYEIVKTFEKKDAVVFYLSDHGQDVFHSSNDYAGHGLNGNKKSMKIALDIPMIIYTSPLFREKRKQLYTRMFNAVDMPYRTDSIMYTIMDIAGIDSVNNISYKHKSLIKE